MSADLYHIEFERSENISNLLQGKYIEPSGWGSPKRRMSFGGSQRSDGISTKSKKASVDTEAVLVKKKGREISVISRPFPVGRYIQFHTALWQVRIDINPLYRIFDIR